MHYNLAAPVRPRKHVGLAVLLAFLFGPFGLMYASVSAGILMLLATLLVLPVTAGLGIFFTAPACMAWAAVAASAHNQRALPALNHAQPTPVYLPAVHVNIGEHKPLPPKDE